MKLKKIFLVASLVALAYTVLMPQHVTMPAMAGDYCNGEWSDDAETYCSNLMQYVKTVVIDQQVGRPKDSVMAETLEAAHTYNMPPNLAYNYVEFIYAQEPPLTADEAQGLLFGGCIDNWEVIQEDAREILKP